MTRICVAGGTGQVGREVVRQALDAGARRRRPQPEPAAPRLLGVLRRRRLLPCGRHHRGRAAGRAGRRRRRRRLPGSADRQGAEELCRRRRPCCWASAQAAGVARAVMLSIVNCDQSAARGIYRSKADKERRVREIVRWRPSRCGQRSSTASVAADFRCRFARVGLIPVIKGARFQTDLAGRRGGGAAGSRPGSRRQGLPQGPDGRRPGSARHGGRWPAAWKRAHRCQGPPDANCRCPGRHGQISARGPEPGAGTALRTARHSGAGWQSTQIVCSLGTPALPFLGNQGTAAPRGYSSVGRALRSHRRGQGFESP